MQKIVILRHGEVDIKNNEYITSKEFSDWIIQYNDSNIKTDFLEKEKIKYLFNKTDIFICSSLKRSIQSIELLNKKPYEINAIFNEAPLPDFNGKFLKLNPKIWLVLFRLLWLFGYSKNCESYSETKQRAKEAVIRLTDLSKQHKNVILIGHGVMNKLIQKELISNNWRETKKMGSKNWDYGIFELF